MTMISLWTVLAVAPYVALCGVLLLYMRFNAAARRSAPVRVGQWVAITGAASGIGKETALAILRGGGSVWAIDLTHEALERGLSEAAAEHGERLRMAAADVTDDKAIRNLAARIEKETGLYGVVNSAGVAIPPGDRRTVMQGAAETDTESRVRPVLEINLIGTMRVNQHLFEALWKSKGRIVNISSVAGRLASPGMSSYAASKHAVSGYSAALRRELAPYGMRVYCVEPGFTKTPLLDTSLQDEGPDLSQTRLVDKTFAMSASREDLVRAFGGDSMQTPDVVADRIVAALFAEHWLPPHILIDHPSKVFAYTLMSILPHHWIDAGIAAAQAYAANALQKKRKAEQKQTK